MAGKYDAFISYSQSADGRMAPAVQRGLQQLARPWHRRRALWIFRDDTGLTVSAALWPSIQQALDDSAYFILLASPAAARSPWVNKEIAHWRATKDPLRILPVLTEGDWRWDEAAGDLEQTSAVPPALRGTFTHEPFHLDLRWARSETDLNLRNARFRLAIANLAAPLHGKPKEDLESEDIRQFRRFSRIRAAAVTGLAILTLLASTLGVAAFLNARRAEREADRAVQEARVAVSRQLAADAKNLSGTDLDLALLLSAEAYRTEPTAQATDGLLSVAMAEPQLAFHLHGHRAAVLALRYPGAGTLLSADDAGVVMAWDVRTGRGRQVADLRAELAVAAISGNGKVLAAAEKSNGLGASNSQRIRIVPLDGGPERALTGHQLDIGTLTFAPGDAVLFSGDAGGMVGRWDLAAGAGRTFALRANSIQSLAVTPDGGYLAVGDMDGKVFGVDPSNGRQQDVQSMAAPARGLAFDRTGTKLAIRDTIGTLRVWDRKPDAVTTVHGGDRSLRTETSGYLSAPSAVAFRPGGSAIAATTGRNGTVYDTASPLVFRGQHGPVHSLAFDPAGRNLALGSEEGPITVWSAAGDPPISRRLTGALPRIQVIAASGDGRVVAAAGCAPAAFRDLGDEGYACGSGSVTVWTDGRARALPSPHRNFVDALTVSPDGRYVTSGDNDGVVVRWDLATNRQERLALGTDAVQGLTSTLVGDTLVAGGFNGAVVAWDAARRAPTVLRKGVELDGYRPPGSFSSITAVAVSGDGTTVFAADNNGDLHGWDRRTGAERTVEGKELVHVRTMAVHPSRPLVYVAFDDGRVEIWEGRLDRKVTTISVPDSTGQVAVSGDGALLAVGTTAGVQLRETSTHRRLGTRAVMDDAGIEAVAFGGAQAPKRLFTASTTGLLSWDLTAEALISHACTTANRNLTPAERASYLPATRGEPTCPGR